MVILMNRKEKRKIRKEVEMFSNVVTIIKQYFPSLIEKLDKLTDTRHQSYVEYTMATITVTRLLGLLCGIKSMRETTKVFNTEETIQNIANLLEIELEEIPHYDTINEVFEKLEIDELRKIQKYMVQRLIRSKMFDKYRYKGKYFQIVIDGTGMVTFKERHCSACEPVIQTCKENKWGYIIRLKEERLKLLGEEIKGLEKAEKENREIIYWNNIKYGEVEFEKEANVIKYKEEKGEKAIEFMWITSFNITENNKEELVYYGRQRWKIENEGFNEQKNGTFDIEHIYSDFVK